MANKQLFNSSPKGKIAPKADTTNNAGGIAYEFTPEHALAQFATTGCLTNTYYVKAEDQLSDVLNIAKQCSSEYIAKCAIYARQKAFMKDLPALLCAILLSRAVHGEAGNEARKFLAHAFPQVIDNDKMLRNFVQIVRSGTTGRKSLGTFGKRLIQQWFDGRKDYQLFLSSVGDKPSLGDIISLAHVKPGDSTSRKATFSYLLGQDEESKATEKAKENKTFWQHEALPDIIKKFEAFKKDQTVETPKVPFQMLTALPLTTKHWTDLAVNGGWHFVRMNLNSFQRHGVLKDAKVVDLLATKLADGSEIAKARVFPYQLFTAYHAIADDREMPMKLKMALSFAMEHATKNVPSFGDNIWVFPDVSGSMTSPVTGNRGTATTKTRCIDVAALVSACILRKSPDARVIPVCTRLHHNVRLNPLDTVLTNATQLSAIQGGGTSLSLGLDYILKEKKPADTIIFISDNESWADAKYGYSGGTGMMTLFNQIQAKNPQAKLVCIDLTPNKTTQAKSSDAVLNVGGFSDNVWTVLEAFTQTKSKTAWVDEIKKISLEPAPVEAKA